MSMILTNEKGVKIYFYDMSGAKLFDLKSVLDVINSWQKDYLLDIQEGRKGSLVDILEFYPNGKAYLNYRISSVNKKLVMEVY